MNTKAETTLTKPVIESVTLTLKMSKQEAQVIASILANVGGRPRGCDPVYCDILKALQAEGINWFKTNEDGKEVFLHDIDGDMYFTGKPGRGLLEEWKKKKKNWAMLKTKTFLKTKTS